MDAKEQALKMFKTHLTVLAEETMDGNSVLYYNAKQSALVTISEVISFHESLFDGGFRQVHIALSSPVKTYLDIMNPQLARIREIESEISKLNLSALIDNLYKK
jgi:hypothetical protein